MYNAAQAATATVKIDMGSISSKKGQTINDNKEEDQKKENEEPVQIYSDG
jgi:hypothetical protein